MIDYSHLSTLLAVERAGSFERAGKLLHISPIGVSRRIAKFEKRLGTRLLSRKPTRPTEAGHALCRYAETIEQLEDEFLAETRKTKIQSELSTGVLKIAVDDGSLAGWIGEVVAKQGQASTSVQPRLMVDIAFIDPDHTLEAMRSGQVVAGLTTAKAPIHGFKAHHIGMVRYCTVASPQLAAQRFPDETVSQRKHSTLPLPCAGATATRWPKTGQSKSPARRPH